MLIISCNDEASGYLERKPGSNTVFYYPLNSTDTVNDKKGFGTAYNLNVNHGVVFGTYQGVDCAYFKAQSGRNGLYYSSNTQLIPAQNFTRACRLYKNSNSSANPRLCSSYPGNSRYGILMDENGKLVVWSNAKTDGYTIPAGEWHLRGMTGSFTSGSYKIYKDGELVMTMTGNGFTPYYGLSIGGPDSGNSTSGTTDKFNGYMSRMVMENVQETADRHRDLFKKTKKYYGL